MQRSQRLGPPHQDFFLETQISNFICFSKAFRRRSRIFARKWAEAETLSKDENGGKGGGEGRKAQRRLSFARFGIFSRSPRLRLLLLLLLALHPNKKWLFVVSLWVSRWSWGASTAAATTAATSTATQPTKKPNYSVSAKKARSEIDLFVGRQREINFLNRGKHDFQLGSIRCKHSVRWQHLSRMKKVLFLFLIKIFSSSEKRCRLSSVTSNAICSW